jgi:hypothetical protein
VSLCISTRLACHVSKSRFLGPFVPVPWP